MNAAPTHLVARASLASMLLALFFAIKELATPPMARPRQAGGLAALEQHDADDDQTADELKNGDKQFHNRRPPIS